MSISIGWQAYMGDQIHRKNSPTLPRSQIQVKKKKILAGPIYIQNPVNGRFWPNLDFRKAGSWTASATNLKLCTKHGWWSIRPPSKFQVKIISIS